MIWQECRKLWKRPAVVLAFLGITLLPFITVWREYPGTVRITETDYHHYSGVMDQDWRKRVAAEWEQTPEEQRTKVQKQAYAYLDFHHLLTDFVDNMQETLRRRDPGYDTNRVGAAYRDLDEAEELRFSSGQSFGAILKNLELIMKCSILFIILQCAAIFTGDRESGMEMMTAVCKHGRRKLFWNKFLACQTSSLFIWLWVNLMSLLAVWIRLGLFDLNGVVQNFHTNASPFLWDQRTYLCVVEVLGLFSAQLVSAAVFVLGYAASSSVKSVLAAFVVVFLPVVYGNFFPVLRFFFPNFLSSDYLWNHYAECRFGTYYIAEWKIAVIEVVVLTVLVWSWCVRCPYSRAKE